MQNQIRVEYRVRKAKEKIEKAVFFFLSNYPTKVFINERLAESKDLLTKSPLSIYDI